MRQLTPPWVPAFAGMTMVKGVSVQSAPSKTYRSVAQENPRRVDQRRAARTFKRIEQRAVRQFIGKAHPHTVKLRPHDDGVNDRAETMHFAPRPRVQADPVDRCPEGFGLYFRWMKSVYATIP